MATTSDWYAVQVSPGKEEATCRLMRRLVPARVLDEAFTPRFASQKKYQGEWRACSQVLFPGYVIAVTPDVQALHDSLTGVPEFTRLLAMGETYLPLEERDRAWIEALTSRECRTVQMSQAIYEGDRVVVTSGPLVGHEAWIDSVNRHKGLAYLRIQMFGRTIHTKVGLAVVARRPSDS